MSTLSNELHGMANRVSRLESDVAYLSSPEFFNPAIRDAIWDLEPGAWERSGNAIVASLIKSARSAIGLTPNSDSEVNDA